MKVMLSRFQGYALDLGIGYLAAVLKAAGHTLALHDIAPSEEGYATLRKKIAEERPDVFGIKVFSRDHPFVEAVCRAAKEALPGLVTLGGGIHVSSAPEECMAQYPSMDFALLGEAEISLPRFLDGIRQGARREDPQLLASVPGIVYRAPGALHCTPVELIEDLDRIPFPDYEAMRIEQYLQSHIFVSRREKPSMSLIATRGCPFRCAFCASYKMSGRHVRARSVDNIVAEITLLHDRYGVEHIKFEDDFFAANKKFVLEFCDKKGRLPFDFTWGCSCSVRNLDEEMVGAMARAGCVQMSIGVESGSPRILEAMNKGMRPDFIAAKIGMIKKAGPGIDLTGYFIIGSPDETYADIDRTIAFASKVPLDLISVQALKIYPATPFYERLKAEGKLEAIDYTKLGIDELQYVPPGMTEKGLARKLTFFYFMFYLRRFRWLRLLKSLRSRKQIVYFARRLMIRLFPTKAMPGKV